MTWIKTVSPRADDKVRRAVEAQRKLYPAEYAVPMHPTEDNHERLRELGFDDRGILQITLIASWFNYINRVADALGVGRE